MKEIKNQVIDLIQNEIGSGEGEKNGYTITFIFMDVFEYNKKTVYFDGEIECPYKDYPATNSEPEETKIYDPVNVEINVSVYDQEGDLVEEFKIEEL